MTDSIQHNKHTSDAQQEIDAVLQRAELWRTYRPIDGALVSDYAEIDLDTHDGRDMHDAEAATIRLFQPKREGSARVVSTEYAELRAVWHEVVVTALMLCTGAVRVIRHGLVRLLEIVSAYVHAFETRSPHSFAFVGGNIPGGVSPDESDIDENGTIMEYDRKLSPQGASEARDTESHVFQSTVPSVPARADTRYEGDRTAHPPIAEGAYRDSGKREGGEGGDSHSYQPFMRPIARSGSEVYARFRASNPEHPAIQSVPTPPSTDPVRTTPSQDYAVTMPLTDMKDVGETAPLTRSDVALSAPAHRTQRPRVWRDAWRIVFSELLGNLTQK